MTSTLQRTINPGALSGRSVVVTRSREQASALSAKLAALGAHVIEIPTIAIEPPASYRPLDEALQTLATYDLLIVTSANTARVLGERFALHSIAPALCPRTVCVGPATAAALAAAGIRVDLVAEEAVAESIIAAVRGTVRGRRILLARAAVARDVLPEALTAEGAKVAVVDAYRTVLACDSLALVAAVFGGAGSPVDALTFTSSSTVSRFAELLHMADIAWPAAAKVFSIGPITTATLQAHGHAPYGEAPRHDVEGLVEAVLRGLAGQ